MRWNTSIQEESGENWAQYSSSHKLSPSVSPSGFTTTPVSGMSNLLRGRPHWLLVSQTTWARAEVRGVATTWSEYLFLQSSWLLKVLMSLRHRLDCDLAISPVGLLANGYPDQVLLMHFSTDPNRMLAEPFKAVCRIMSS